MLETLVGNGVTHLDTAIRPTLVHYRPVRFDHFVLELVANPQAATQGKGDLTIRMRCVGTRVWLLVADAARGMTAAELRRPLGPLEGLSIGHGGGTRQVPDFAREADARFKIRSRPGKGAVVAPTLPV
jgi:signal transduction histidine kinase